MKKVYKEGVKKFCFVILLIFIFIFCSSVSVFSSPVIKGAVDIIVCMDTTGSMSDEINEVKNNTNWFANQLKQKGFNFRLGLITYRDQNENNGYYPHSYGDLTADEKTFISWVSGLSAGGGGDWEESGVGAMQLAIDMFDKYGRVTAGKMIIVVTDAPFHWTEWYTGVTVEAIGRRLGEKI